MVHRLGLFRGTWDLPGPGIKPVASALAGKLLTTGPLESPSLFIKHILRATPCAHGWLFVCDMNRAGSLPDPSMVLIWVWLPHFKAAKRDRSGNIEQSAIIQRTGEWSALPLSSWCCLPPPGVSTSPQHSPRPRASSWTASQHT